MFGLSTVKLIGLGLGVIALLAAVLWFRSVLNERAELRLWQEDVTTATRAAANRPKLAEANVAQQITLIGEAHKNCKTALGLQNQKVQALGDTTKQQQNATAEAEKRALQRAERVGAVVDGLLSSARSTGATARPCEPSKALREAWR